MMGNRSIRILLNIIIWWLIYLLPYFVQHGSITVNNLLDKGGVIHFVSTLFLIAYTYFNYYTLIPKVYLRKQYLFYVSLVIACALLVLWFPNVFGSTEAPHLRPGPPPDNFHKCGPHDGDGPDSVFFGLGYNIILFVICTLGGISIRQRLELIEVQREKLDAELSFLKAQINPHFLFNTLNSIYSLSLQKSDDAPMAIIQLSDLMRHLLKDSEADYVELQKEVSYISNYIALQRRRLGDTVKIEYTPPQGIEQEKIAPLVLMSFIENAFKHGVNPDEDSEIFISMTLEGKSLHLVVRNNKVVRVQQEGIMGIGLKNAEARLQHLYSQKHVLEIEDGEKTFSVNLKIDLA